MREHEAWTIILNNELDDIICELKSDEMKERMKKFAVKLWDAVAARAKEIETKGMNVFTFSHLYSFGSQENNQSS